jgi:hypothetical protein
MIKSSFVKFVFVSLMAVAPKAYSADVAIQGYNYSVTDIKSKGLTAQRLFNSLSTSWMDLEHSVCANRSHVWSYDLHRKFGINTGTIFIFFGEKVWEGEKHKYWYHAGTYVVEDGKELVLEQSYPSEVFGPLSVVDWMHNEMEGKADASKCVELKNGEDQDMAERFYHHSFLPHKRNNGKKAYHCYYRKVPGYIAYPETTAELELGVDEDGNKIDYDLKNFDQSTLFTACVDAYTGRKFLKKGAAKSFCKSYL